MAGSIKRLRAILKTGEVWGETPTWVGNEANDKGQEKKGNNCLKIEGKSLNIYKKRAH